MIGTCRLCGENRKLSFEHVPPRSCFNDKPVYVLGGERLLREEFNLDSPRGSQSQRGLGSYTLCEQCNNDTGAWYGNAFAEWTHYAARVLFYTRTEPVLYYPFRCFPLRVLKQIVIMFFSASHQGFNRAHPELVKFCLNKEYHYYPENLRIYSYYNPSGRGRMAGVTGRLNSITGEMSVICEVSWFPMGYVLALRGGKPDDRVFDITFFSRYFFNDWKEFSLKINALPIYTHFPGDYRTRDEVNRDRLLNEAEAKKGGYQPAPPEHR